MNVYHLRALSVYQKVIWMCVLSTGILSAKAKPARFNLTNSLTMEQRGDNRNLNQQDDHYSIAFNRFNFGGEAYDLQFGGRLDSVGLLDPPSDAYQNDWIRLERMNLAYQWDQVTLEAGDLYQQLGRGQLLALRKVDELGLDIALRGSRIAYSDRQRALKIFAGFANVVNLDSVSQRFVEDEYDLITGGYLEQRVSSGNLGIMYVYMAPEQQQYEGLELQDASSSGGLYYEAPSLFEWLGLYVELDAQQRRAIEQVHSGYAGYATLDLHHQDTTVMIEGIWLDDFEQRGSQNSALKSRFNYNQAPTLERIDQEIAELYDMRGVRLRAQEDFWDGDLSFHLNGLYKINRFDDPLELKQFHLYGGAEAYYDLGSSRFSMSGGHRYDEQHTRTVRTWSHGELDWVHAFGSGYSSHLTTQYQYIRVEEDPAFLRGSSIVGLERSELGGLSFELGLDTQNPNARQHFYAGILRWDITSWLLLQSVVGSQRGGIKCVAGVCRDFPSFSGVRLQLIGRYR